MCDQAVHLTENLFQLTQTCVAGPCLTWSSLYSLVIALVLGGKHFYFLRILGKSIAPAVPNSSDIDLPRVIEIYLVRDS